MKVVLAGPTGAMGKQLATRTQTQHSRRQAGPVITLLPPAESGSTSSPEPA
jgi:hypothetical protein